ncbi:hypothetical protein [Microbacterium sulfonylureivorans]|uniref:hypothetical protein n=1 Tax=Microbacterium sulfonylureivorans TaxID=2486854 RepID=UPI000FD8FBD7|nr:hypothetical protein [Microbacterium sulfonylureivorans]
MSRNNETPAGGPGLENIAGERVPLQATGLLTACVALLNGDLQPHQLPWPWPLVWNDGFRQGQVRMQSTVDRLEREADHWYFVANNPAEVVAERDRWLKHFSVVQARKADAA